MQESGAQAVFEGGRRSLLLVINFLRGGGAERQLTQMARYWSERGVEVTVATFTSAEAAADFYPLPGSVRRIHLNVSLKFASFPKAVLRVANLIKEVKPDVVLSFSEASNAVCWPASRLAGCRCCLSIRTDPQKALENLNFVWRLPISLAYKHCDVLAVQTDAAAKWVRSELGRAPVVGRNPLRRMDATGIPRENLIVSVGSLIPKKGHDVLLRAFSRVHFQFPLWRLAIVGNGPRRQEISALAAELGVGEKLEMPGQVTNVSEWLERAGLFVMTSSQEGYPNALIEAMAMGCPVISTDCNHGPREVIEDQSNGLLVAVGDDAAVAAAMTELIESPELRSELSGRAVLVREMLDEERVMRQWTNLVFGELANGC